MSDLTPLTSQAIFEILIKAGSPPNVVIAPASPSTDGLMSAADKTKLDTVASGANNYVHPATHPASVTVQDARHRFITDVEKATLFKRRGIPKVMATPPTFAALQNGSSAITNAQFIDVFSGGTTPNPVFTYTQGTIKVAGNVFPQTLAVANFAISSPIGGTTFSAGSYNTGPIIWEIMFDGTQIEIQNLGNNSRFRVLVDEGDGYQYTSNSTGNVNGTWTNDGSGYRQLITFPSRKPRNIRYECVGNGFQGVTVGGNDTVSPATRPVPPKCVILGDSFTEPTGSDNGLTGWASVCCNILGWEPSVSGSGGTGYINTGASPRVNFMNRVVTDVINQKPDYVLIAGGINDASYPVDQIQSAASTLYQTIQDGLPNAVIIVVGNWFPRLPGSLELGVSTALRTAALSRGLPYIDVLNGTSYKGDGTQLVSPTMGPWVTGTGNSGAPISTGNASIYTGPDNTHPTQAGHNYLGNRAAMEIARILYA